MLYLFLSILLFTAISLLAAAASRRANTNLIALIMNIFSVAAPILILAPSIFKKTLVIDRPVFLLAAAAGICVGLYAVTINKSFLLNKVGIVAPVVFGGTILLATVMSYFLFKETLKTFEIVGLFLILSGIGFIIYARSVA